MTTPPDHIWLARAWAETFTTRDERENVEPYVRRDPAVLAELPEVRALVENAVTWGFLSAAPGEWRVSDIKRVADAIAAAIREGRNG